MPLPFPLDSVNQQSSYRLLVESSEYILSRLGYGNRVVSTGISVSVCVTCLLRSLINNIRLLLHRI
jgi:hypothetical protein